MKKILMLATLVAFGIMATGCDSKTEGTLEKSAAENAGAIKKTASDAATSLEKAGAEARASIGESKKDSSK